MIKFQPISEPNDYQASLLAQLRSWEPEVRELLPNLPANINIEINNDYLINGFGVGGYPKDKDTIQLSFDPNFDGDKKLQQVNFRGSLFHELYHLGQGFFGEDNKYKGSPFLHNGILEGAATKFEMIRAGSKPGWGDYPKTEIKQWFNEVKELEYTPDGQTWGKWKFYDPDTGRAWILYRVGCYVIDEAIKTSGEEIEDLVSLSPSEILELSQLL